MNITKYINELKEKLGNISEEEFNKSMEESYIKNNKYDENMDNNIMQNKTNVFR